MKIPISNFGGNSIKIWQSSDSWALQDSFFYPMISDKVLLILQTGTNGGISGRVMAMNLDFNKPDVLLMLLDVQFYLRYADIKLVPFVIIDK